MECVNAGRIWPFGTTADAAWLDHALGYAGHRAVTWFATAFEASCRLGLPAVPVVDGLDQAAHDRAVVRLLSAFGAASWWLGYLDYGIGINIVFDKAPRARIFSWDYVLVRAGAREALSWRSSSAPDVSWKGALPDLIFPTDHAWVMFTPWDDHWSFIGGPRRLIARINLDPTLRSRVQPVARRSCSPIQALLLALKPRLSARARARATAPPAVAALPGPSTADRATAAARRQSRRDCRPPRRRRSARRC